MSRWNAFSEQKLLLHISLRLPAYWLVLQHMFLIIMEKKKNLVGEFIFILYQEFHQER